MALTVLALVGALFVIGALVIAVAGRPLPAADRAQLWELYRVEFLIVAVALVPAYAGGWVFLAGVLLFALRALSEWLRTYGHPPLAPLGLALYGVALTLLTVTHVQGIALSSQWLAVALLVLLGATLFPRTHPGPAPFAAVLFPLLPLAYLLEVRNLEQGFLWLVLVYAVVEVNDAFATVFGKLFGRRHVFPRLSPRKTLEGLAGGSLSAGLAGWLFAHYVTGLDTAQALGATAVILLGGLLGDLATSALKRAQGVKDFPGIHALHGGILDIYDSYLVAVPVFYFYHRLVIA